MDHTLAECGLRLRYLRGSRVLGVVDRQRLLADLLTGAPPSEAAALFVRPQLAEYAHVVVAYDLGTGTAIGLLCAHDHQASRGTFLWLESGFVAQTARGQNLLRRMIAVMLIRIVSQASAPVAVATMTPSPVGVHVLQQMAAWLPDARFAPTAEGAIVDLGAVALARDITATLGRRFVYEQASRSVTAGLEVLQTAQAVGYASRAIVAASPMLAMLDLRTSCEGALIADLRKLYRMPPGRSLRMPSANIPADTSQDPAEPPLQLHAPCQFGDSRRR